MSTFKAVLLKGNIHKRKDGTYNIKIRITHKRKSDYISTNLYVHWQHFDRDSGTVDGGGNREFININLTEKLLYYRKEDLKLGDRREFMTVQEIKKYILSGKSTGEKIDFYEFVNEYLVSVKESGTRETYESLLASLKRFAGNELAMSDVNLRFLEDYENHLYRRGVRNGIVNYMSSFRTLFKKARKWYNDEAKGIILIPHYPFEQYDFPERKLKTKEHIVPVEDLREFINYKPKLEGEQFAKDMSLLTVYLIGIEAKDLFYLTKPKNGRVHYDRFKTGGEYSIKLEPEALEIIKRYEGEKLLLNVSERFEKHKSFYRYINNHLGGQKAYKKKRAIEGIFPSMGSELRPTTKWWRHTWATIARNDCRIDKDDVALCLGHSDEDNRVTDLYIKYDYSIIDESNRKVLDFILYDELI